VIGGADLDARLSAAPAVRVGQLGDGAVLLDLGTSQLYSLDTIGARMWAAIVEGPSLRHARDALSGMFEVEPERLETDLLAFAQELLALGLLRQAGES
jgi:hypothetical protein